MLPLLDFVGKLAAGSSEMSDAILDAEFLDMLLRMHICDNSIFYTSTAAERDIGLVLQNAGRSCIRIIGHSTTFHSFVAAHPISSIWPQIIDNGICASLTELIKFRQYYWTKTDKYYIGRRLRAMESPFNTSIFTDMLDYLCFCIDLVEFTK